MNHEKWGIVRLHGLKDWSCYVGFFFSFFLSFLFAAFALRRFSNCVGRLRPSTSRSQSATAEDSDWTKVADMWPRPRPDTRIMADEVRQRPDRDASWVERVLFFQEGGGQLWKQKKKSRTAGNQRSHHSVTLDTDLNKLIGRWRFIESCCPHATPVTVFNSCVETSLNTQRSHIAH